MSPERPISPKNRWSMTAVCVTAAVFVVAALLGFVFLPYAQAGVKPSSLWDTICAAAGVPRQSSAAEPVTPDFKTSAVVMTVATLGRPSPESIGRGATLAHQCAICHGPTGISRADSPNLAGQFIGAIYKQLEDFKSGARTNAVMSPLVVNLSEQDMRDLAAYYAYLPRLPAYHPTQASPAPLIVTNGAPLRGIAPCGSCHGGLENKPGSPWLEGQSPAYIKAQLQAFATGQRRNDVSQQMRNIARALTPQEIDQAADYYSSQPPEFSSAN